MIRMSEVEEMSVRDEEREIDADDEENVKEEQTVRRGRALGGERSWIREEERLWRVKA